MKLLHGLLIGMFSMLPACVFAQVVDFDSVCAMPPCTLSTQYAPFGITFVPTPPTSAQIVESGNDGPISINGDRYARITTAPTQLAITLSRNATFFSFFAARTESSTGTVILAVSAFKAGVQVGSTLNVPIDLVNTWLPISFTNAGGFDSILLSGSGAPNSTFGIDAVQFGGTCYGFADVAPGSSICNSVEWLANRSITLGCAAGVYCPSDPVSRAAMSLFMNRLGTALTPVFVNREQFSASGNLGTTEFPNGSDGIVCASNPVTLLGFPRTVLLNGFASFRVNVAGPIMVQPVVSGDDLTWVRIGNDVWNASEFGTLERTSVSTTVLSSLAPGARYRFGLYLRRLSGAAATLFSNGECRLTAAIFNRDNASAPFDADPNQAPRRE